MYLSLIIFELRQSLETTLIMLIFPLFHGLCRSTVHVYDFVTTLLTNPLILIVSNKLESSNKKSQNKKIKTGKNLVDYLHWADVHPGWRCHLLPLLLCSLHPPGHHSLHYNNKRKIISYHTIVYCNIISSLWIWKGVSATLWSGRYTLSYPRGRYMCPICMRSVELQKCIF